MLHDVKSIQWQSSEISFVSYKNKVTSVGEELFIADTNNHRIRKIDKNGIITTVAGNTEVEPLCEFECIPQIAPMLITQSTIDDSQLATETEFFFPTDVKIAAKSSIIEQLRSTQQEIKILEFLRSWKLDFRFCNGFERINHK